MQISRSSKPHSAIDYFILPSGKVDVFLHKNEQTETDEEGNVIYVAEEVYLKTNASKEYIEAEFEKVWNETENILSIDEVKFDKIEQLRKACENDILNGFTATIVTTEYTFSFDREAQANFTGTLALLNSGIITGIPEWTAKNNGVYERINMTVDEFKQVALTGLGIKDYKIKRLRNDLIPIVENALTIEEVNNVVW